MADNSFEQQINRFANKTEEQLLAVARESITAVVEQAQTPRAKGGKMPVDTGFLRNSGAASIGGLPYGDIRGEKEGTYGWSGTALNAVLANMKLGDIFYFGWTAVYARQMEMRYAFLDAAVQNFSKYVDKAIRKLRR